MAAGPAAGGQERTADFHLPGKLLIRKEEEIQHSTVQSFFFVIT